MRSCYQYQPRPARGFSLIELLVVISIITLLLGILLPALGNARKAAFTAKCLSNMRNMEVAHWMYMADFKGQFIEVGLSHGAGDEDEDIAWINTLSAYYGSTLLARSPIDTSPHWGPDGTPVHPGPPPVYRRTSYGCNNFLSRRMYETSLSLIYPGGPYRLDNVPRPAATVHFVIMAFTGPFASADHPHVENWGGFVAPASAAGHLQINAHGGPVLSWDSVSNYGYLDGHAQTRKFREVFTNLNTHNSFNPQLAR